MPFEIPLAEPNIQDGELQAADAALSANGPRMGSYIPRFEEKIAEASGTKWAVATITGTAALHMTIGLLGISGKVTVGAHTFPAASHMLRQNGCAPVYIDAPVNHDFQWIVTEDKPWPIVVDMAPAIGLQAQGTLACLSFNGNKTLTTGQGGAIVGDDADLQELVRRELTPKDGGVFNYQMANLNAAIGCAQMSRLDSLMDRKNEIWERYADKLPMCFAGDSRWMAIVDLSPVSATSLVSILGDKGIEARHFGKSQTSDIPDRQLVALPCGTTLMDEQQDKVIEACAEYL
jgi:perosamine synthetase